MIGVNAKTGAVLGGDDHLRQSIETILFTPIGARVMKRDFGSRLVELIDQPFNGVTRQLLYAATAVALMLWEPRVRLKKVALTPGGAAGAFLLDLELERRDTPRAELFRLSVPLLKGPNGLAYAIA